MRGLVRRKGNIFILEEIGERDLTLEGQGTIEYMNVSVDIGENSILMGDVRH
jgi:hypothetical protein